MKKKFVMGAFAFRVNRLQLSLLVVILLQLAAISGLNAQSVTVRGNVKNAKGEPLQGVSITIKGDQDGTSTDSKGDYTIAVPNSKAILVFSNVGFADKEEIVGSRQTINVDLATQAGDLDEVVVIGYGGKQKKRDVTGAISSVTAKQIEERQPVNLFDALQGQAAGVLIVNDGGGAPGAEGSIQIRGLSTLNGGNGPLYLVDGVINPNGASINPMDIERVEVLKDAASAAIYGARAANGVIIITTKRGKEGKPRIDLNYLHVYGKLAHKLPQNNSAEVREFRRIQRANSNGSTGGNTDSLNPGFNSDNDLQELLLGNTGQKNQLNFGISGGKKDLNFYAGVNYLDDRSIILNSWIKRVQSRFNLEYQASEKFRYSANITFNWQKGNSIPLARTVAVAFDRPAYSLIYYPDGSLTSYIGSKRNPVANALYELDLAERFSSQFNNSIRYQVYKDLAFTTNFNVILDNEQSIGFSPRFVSARKDQNSGSNEQTKNFSWEYQSFLNYNKTINGDHSIQGTLGFSADRRRFDRLHSEYDDIVSEEIFVTFPSYLDATQTYSDATANTAASIFGRLNYSYKGRYIVAGVFRRDGSSRFGEENKWGNFYSGSAAWRFSSEKFMDWAGGVLTDGKLRFSYGQVGNDRIDDYESFTKIQFNGNYNGVGGAAISTTYGNTFIKWETTTQKNIGLDLSFFNGRLELNADYYVKTTKDLLYPRNLPQETGFSRVNVNVGSIENRGFELAVRGTPFAARSGGVNWNIGGNISFERGKILELANGLPFIAGNKWYVEEGGRIGNFFGWENVGVFSWDESNAFNDNWEKLTLVLDKDGNPQYTNGAPDYTFNGKPYTGTVHNLYDPAGKLRGGDAEWLNLNKDSLIDDGDRHVIGNAQPDFYFGLINNISYKQFSLSFLVNASFGGEIYNTLLYNQSYPSNTGAGSPDMVYNVWRKPGDIKKYPYYPERASRGSLKKDGNSLYIEDASFVRLSSARLSYNLSPKLANKMFMKGLTAFIYGSNLVTWTNYRGFDPEFSSSNVLMPGEDRGRYPKRREVGLGVNVNF